MHRANRYSLPFWYVWFEMEPRLWMTDANSHQARKVYAKMTGKHRK